MSTVRVITNILEANERIAAQNAAMFARAGVFVINLMSSPGAGKTSLIEKTIASVGGDLRVGVIEGDIQGSVDAERVMAAGVPAVQINTGGACHLDGNMIRDAIEQLDLGSLDLLIVENVGNLVCPAEFRLGEDAKVMLWSVAEGDDKPLKYPLMFQQSAALVVNKIDLLPHVDCSVDLAEQRARALNPSVQVFRVSCRSGQGLDTWVQWLRGVVGAKRSRGS